jgi:hypothetical protein
MTPFIAKRKKFKNLVMAWFNQTHKKVLISSLSTWIIGTIDYSEIKTPPSFSQLIPNQYFKNPIFPSHILSIIPTT